MQAENVLERAAMENSGTKREKVTRYWEKLHNELNNF
jgi:hypothetical protein